MTARTFVLDTSVLLSSPNAIFAFAEHKVVLPLVVIKELESKRHDPELGHLARKALRHLETLRVDRAESLADGVEVNADGGTLRIEINHVSKSSLPETMREDRTHDTRVLAVAKGLDDDGHNVTLVSKDMPMRILAEAIGLTAEEFLNEQIIVSDEYTGIATVDLTDAEIDALYDGEDVPVPGEHPVNTALILRGASGTQRGLAVVGADGAVKKFDTVDAFGVKGRSVEQKTALHHLLNRDIGIVSLGGPAGTGKTLLALAAGLEAVMERGEQKRIVVFRPLHAVGGQDLGYLPGTEAEKMNPWGEAIYDALDAFTSKAVVDEVKARGLLEVLPLTHIRGRTLTDTWVVIDEAQNLERSVLLTALTRLGANSKVVLSWDVAQRDNLRVGRHDGIHAVVERLKGQPLFAHTTLRKSERSAIAALVASLLDDGLN